MLGALGQHGKDARQAGSTIARIIKQYQIVKRGKSIESDFDQVFYAMHTNNNFSNTTLGATIVVLHVGAVAEHVRKAGRNVGGHRQNANICVTNLTVENGDAGEFEEADRRD